MKNIRKIWFYGICTLFLFIGVFTARGQEPFDMRSIPAPLYRCPIYDGAADPASQWNSEEGEWWLVYTQRRANVQLLPGVA